MTLNDPERLERSQEMLDAGFAHYSEVTLHKAGDTIANARVFGGDTASVPPRGEEYRDGVSAARREREAAARALGEKIWRTGREDGTGGFGRISARDCALGTRYAGLRRGIAASGGRKILR